MATENQLSLKELYEEAICRLWRLGYIAAADWREHCIFYSARDHFLMNSQELPLILGDKFALTFTISSDWMFCDPVRTNALASTFYMDFSDITFFIMYYELTPEQRQMFIE
jgi:hypothetical protein